MPLTRREFSAAASGSIALVVLGSSAEAEIPRPPVEAFDEDPKEKNKAHLATEPFMIGPLSKYKTVGLYDEFKKDKGVWVVSDGKALVVFSATCTHVGCTTNWNAEQKAFVCPCHHSKFDLEGTNTAGKAKRPLDRCALRLTTAAGGGQEVEVDPRKRFRKEEWSDPSSSLALG